MPTFDAKEPAVQAMFLKIVKDPVPPPHPTRFPSGTLLSARPLIGKLFEDGLLVISDLEKTARDVGIDLDGNEAQLTNLSSTIEAEEGNSSVTKAYFTIQCDNYPRYVSIYQVLPLVLCLEPLIVPLQQYLPECSEASLETIVRIGARMGVKTSARYCITKMEKTCSR